MLTAEQKDLVKAWVAEGLSLSDVQKRIKEEFDLRMLYMDVRLLVLELGAAVKDKDEPKPQEIAAMPGDAQHAEPLPEDEAEFEDEEMPEEPLPKAGTGLVSVSLDQIVVPGAMVSGDVTFSDGERARWIIDNMGRFGLEPSTPGYRPADGDLQEFQIQLRGLLQKRGLM